MATMAGLKMTQAVQEAIQKATSLNLRITSGYRSPADDIRVGGTGKGYHTLGQALDFAGSKSSMDAFAKWAKGTGKFRSVLWQVPDHYDHVHISWNAPTTSYTNPLPTLKEGSTGGLVQQLQNFLGGLKVDGIFGPKTEEAVKKFQENRSIESDGIVGKNTWAELQKGGGAFFY